MSGIPGTNVSAMIVPFDDQDIYATHNDKYGRGGFRVEDTLASRDAITAPRRKEGMWVRVVETGKTYQLGVGLTNADWTEVTFGGSDGSLGYIAAVAIGGTRAVTLDANSQVVYADSSLGTHLNKVLGISLGAADAGATVSIRRTGELVEPTWNWTLNAPVFLTTNGLMSQTPPTTGFSLIVGFPVAATKLFISLREPILLS